MQKKINSILFYGCALAFLMLMYVWGYNAGRTQGRIDTLSYEAGRLRMTCERQRVMQDLSFYTGDIDGTRGPLTITAEDRYFRWYGHCMAAGKRVDPNIIHWEEEVHELE